MKKKHRVFGLIGFPLSHSFSKKYFSEKFKREGWPHCRYQLFPLREISALPGLIASTPGLSGLNVTIPHKQAVLPWLDEVDTAATTIGAVNVIKIKDGKLTGYNSDVYGFELSLRNLLGPSPHSGRQAICALVLGTGGASLAVRYILEKMSIPYRLVSRTFQNGRLTYADVDPQVIRAHRLIINCTPVGTYPDVEACLPLPYEAAGPHHFFYDLVYNPAESLFLKKAKAQGASTTNGLPMLHLQAEKAWEIWNS
ncbi:MAG TPA: shikimate dehydrogenase [Bacteroidetes bacterium]|nr:shikimate dehydrogenase [Bacteroidota bacterium]